MQRAFREVRNASSLGIVCKRMFATSAADIGEIGVISGAPDHTFKRKVVVVVFEVYGDTLPTSLTNISSQVGIFAPSRTPSQQGLSQTIEGPGKGPAWKIEFETMAK